MLSLVAASATKRPVYDQYHADGPTGPEANGTEVHLLRLIHGRAGWRVVADDYSDEFRTLHPVGTDFAALQASFPRRFREWRQQQADLLRRQGPREPETSGVVTPLVSSTYSRDNAASYADTYTDDNLMDTTNYNHLFRVIAGNDCTNFVSQCVWYGFGGVNDSAHIQAHSLPMMYWMGAGTNWYADSSSSCRGWDNVASFHTMVTSNYYGNTAGVQGYNGSLGVTWKGDVVISGNSQNLNEHAFMVVGAADTNGDGYTDYNGLYVSSHSNNRRHRRLIDLVDQSEITYYLYIIRFKIP